MTNITYTDDKIEIIKSVINSDSVSLEQIGMVALLLFGEFETVNTRSIINSVSNGQTTVTKTIKALENMNVLYKHRGKINGRFSSYNYVVSKANSTSLRSPCVVKQHMVEAHMDSSYADKPVCEVDKIDMSYNNIYNNNISYDDISIISYPYRDSDDRNDVIDNTNTNEDLFLLSLSSSDHIYDVGDTKSKKDCNVQAQICYDDLKNEHNEDMDLIDMICNIMSETYSSNCGRTRISGQFVSTRIVVSQLMKLGKTDIEYVIDCVKNNSRKIRSIKPYLLTSLYNAAVHQEGRKVADKYSNKKSNSKHQKILEPKCDTGTINMDLYKAKVEREDDLYERLGAGEITMEEFKRLSF